MRNLKSAMEALSVLPEVSWKQISFGQEAAHSVFGQCSWAGGKCCPCQKEQISLILPIICYKVHWGHGQFVWPYACPLQFVRYCLLGNNMPILLFHFSGFVPFLWYLGVISSEPFILLFLLSSRSVSALPSSQWCSSLCPGFFHLAQGNLFFFFQWTLDEH